jgi:hypothetical protein
MVGGLVLLLVKELLMLLFSGSCLGLSCARLLPCSDQAKSPAKPIKRISSAGGLAWLGFEQGMEAPSGHGSPAITYQARARGWK